MKKIPWSFPFIFFLFLTMAVIERPIAQADAATPGQIVINELAWMGTTTTPNDEWIELRNTTSADIDLNGWVLKAQDGTPTILLTGIIPANHTYLLERTDDISVPGIEADQIYTGVMENGGEILELLDNTGAVIDTVETWYAGDNASKATMARTNTGDWETSTIHYDLGLGTPREPNFIDPGSLMGHVNQVLNGLGAINVYFNKDALTDYATPNNFANYAVNLETRLQKRIHDAKKTIDLATYEINLSGIVDALIDRAAEGVTVRVIADAKTPEDEDAERIGRYETMRIYLEKMKRGRDSVVGTDDDIHLFADSPIFAVTDSFLRKEQGLPDKPTGLQRKRLAVGNQTVSGHLLADAEQKTDGGYFAPGPQMHNKYVIIDAAWVWTGSWNFTVTGLYGSESNRQSGLLEGNTQHAVELHSPELAAIFKTEFDESCGSAGPVPDPEISNYHNRKGDNTPHQITVGGRNVEIYFSPGDDAIGHLRDYINNEAHSSVYFTIFAWSTQSLVDALKVKWEGSPDDQQGTLTGFDLKGVFDSSFWNQWWSASIDMTGRQGSRESTNNPNTRWANTPPVFRDGEERKLHSKTMIIDVCTDSDPAVVIGSTNWSTNGNDINDENLLIIHDGRIANQFLQEFYARYQMASGPIPDPSSFVCQ